jgi:hypothetical protein
MSSDPLKSAVEGTVHALLTWSDEKVREYAQKFKQKDVLFLQDVETIEVALKQRKTSEWAIFRENIKDEKLRVLFLMGLTLRGIEGTPEKCIPVRDKIVKNYGIRGLHVAQFVQNGIFAKYIASFLERAFTPDQMRLEIENLFKNIELTNSFIQHDYDEDREVDKIGVRLLSNSPDTYVISGLMSAKEKCKTICQKVIARVPEYSVETYETELKIIIFLHKQEI